MSDTLGGLFQGLILIRLVAFEVFFQKKKKIHKSSFSGLSAHVKSDYYCLSFHIPYCLVSHHFYMHEVRVVFYWKMKLSLNLLQKKIKENSVYGKVTCTLMLSNLKCSFL